MRSPWWTFLTVTLIAFITNSSHAEDPAKQNQPEIAKPKTATLAHIRLSGAMDEAPVAEDPLFGSAENFKAKLDRLRKAKTDANVQGLVLHLDGLAIRWGKAHELTQAIADFKKSGKKVYAYLENGAAIDYLVGLSCDEIVMPEAGWLMLIGMRAEISFYKDMFKLIGVQADFLQMGDFKGASEPYTRSEMSPEFKQQLTGVLQSFYDKSYLTPIAEGRAKKGLTIDKVRKLVDEGPYTPKSAMAAGLIDRVGYPDDIETAFKQHAKVDMVKVTKDYGKNKPEELNLSNPFDFFKLLAPSKPKSSSKPKVAVIYALGPIMTGKGGESLFGGNVVGSTTVVEAIKQAENDATVKAIVLRVDSPGGSALASDLIWRELTRSKKPVVASMGDIAASGGYYISMAARKIYAEPGTLTGSIGVVGGKLVTKGLFEKVGIKTEVIAFGANSGVLSTETPWTPSERKAMSTMMHDVYDIFLTKALAGRNKAGRAMTREQLDKLAAGRLWSGHQAKENGLVDELGTLDDAIAAAKELAGIKGTDTDVLALPKPRNLLDTLLDMQMNSKSPNLSAILAKELHKLDLQGHARLLEAMLQLKHDPVWLMMPHDVTIR